MRGLVGVRVRVGVGVRVKLRAKVMVRSSSSPTRLAAEWAGREGPRFAVYALLHELCVARPAHYLGEG